MKKWLYVLFTVIIVIAIFYFSFSAFDLTSTNADNDSDNKHGGKIVIGLSSDIETLNPVYGESKNAQELIHLILLGLADLNEKSEFVPELAESWEHSEDHLELTYHLRRDAVWSDGKPITAEDVTFTYELIMDSSAASPRQGITDFIKDVIMLDQHTVKFIFTEPYPTQVFDTAGEILPKHILENADRKALNTHPFGRNPVASGPFKLGKWVSQQYIELMPNEEYFGEKPFLDRVIFKIIPDKTSMLMQLKSGEIDMMINVPAVEVAALNAQKDRWNIHRIDGRVYYYLGYNHQNKLFANSEIRRALTMAIDRQKIIDALLYGFGKPCLGPIPPMLSWAYSEDVRAIPYDPEEAIKILSEKGWQDSDRNGWLDRDGQDFRFTIKTSAGNQLKSDVAVIIQEQMRRIGIQVEVKTVEWTTFLKQLQSNDFDACINGWSTSFYIDPTPIFHSDSKKLFNFISYKNPQVDQLIETGRVEMNRHRAAQIWKEFQETVYDDQPYTFLFWIDKVAAVNNQLANVTPIALSAFYNIEKWYQKGIIK